MQKVDFDAVLFLVEMYDAQKDTIATERERDKNSIGHYTL